MTRASVSSLLKTGLELRSVAFVGAGSAELAAWNEFLHGSLSGFANSSVRLHVHSSDDVHSDWHDTHFQWDEENEIVQSILSDCS